MEYIHTKFLKKIDLENIQFNASHDKLCIKCFNRKQKCLPLRPQVQRVYDNEIVHLHKVLHLNKNSKKYIKKHTGSWQS